jgi:hypothetical protein
MYEIFSLYYPPCLKAPLNKGHPYYEARFTEIVGYYYAIKNSNFVKDIPMIIHL